MGRDGANSCDDVLAQDVSLALRFYHVVLFLCRSYTAMTPDSWMALRFHSSFHGVLTCVVTQIAHVLRNVFYVFLFHWTKLWKRHESWLANPIAEQRMKLALGCKGPANAFQSAKSDIIKVPMSGKALLQSSSNIPHVFSFPFYTWAHIFVPLSYSGNTVSGDVEHLFQRDLSCKSAHG